MKQIFFLLTANVLDGNFFLITQIIITITVQHEPLCFKDNVMSNLITKITMIQIPPFSHN